MLRTVFRQRVCVDLGNPAVGKSMLCLSENINFLIPAAGSQFACDWALDHPDEIYPVSQPEAHAPSQARWRIWR